MEKFKVKAPFLPTGDQPTAINDLVKGCNKNMRFQALLGVTGSGKTLTMAHVIERLQKPTLIVAPNKTLAAQLCSEFKEFFPENAVEYFVSYYDYYQPEAYLPKTDLYIEKDSSINEEIDKLRHSATSSLMTRNDVLIVASVSCIYGLGSPEEYAKKMVLIEKNKDYDRDEILKRLLDIRYERNDYQLEHGIFRVRGDVIEIFPSFTDLAFRISMYGDQVEKISIINPVTGVIEKQLDKVAIYPATHFVTSDDKFQKALKGIEDEMKERLAFFRKENKLLEAQRLEMRTNYDLEMLREIGYCNGIENYSRHLWGRKSGERPAVLIDYFPQDFLIIIDESHITIPQLNGMYNGDRSRKETLVEYGFRLPSALDNRPLMFEEFEQLIKQAIFVSATPGPYELKNSEQIVEQIIRPTGLIDPEIVVKPTKNQIDDLIKEINMRVKNQERVLVTTLTKKMAEDLAEYLNEVGINVRYLHSEIETLERVEILTNLRKGQFDVLVGINLLREGLDLPEVSLVAILDADKEGFLRSERSLIQTIGRAARNVSGQVIMYADEVTESMTKALNETNRRRKIQNDYNIKHDIEPKTIQKKVTDIIQAAQIREEKELYRVQKDIEKELRKMPADEIQRLIASLEEEMRLAAEELEFEQAALLRDRIWSLREELLAKNRK